MSNLPAAPPGPPVKITDKYVFFYGYELQVPEGRLQSWYPSAFSDPQHPGAVLHTAEHYYMYRKALAMSDGETAERVLKAATPREANKLGREVKNFDSEKWKGMVDQVAENANHLKFSQVGECRIALLGTGEKEIVEASPVDRNWGIGFDADHGEGHESEWGKNFLGKELMRVRKRLRDEGKL